MEALISKSFFHSVKVLVALIVLSLVCIACGGDDDENSPDTPEPTITAFSPTSGTTGAEVAITGTNFSTATAGNTVKFNGSVATVSDATATSLTVIVPEDGSTGKITVQVGSKSATSTDDFVYITDVSTVSTLAGSGVAGSANGSGTAAQFDFPRDIAVDAAGNIYVADRENRRIRKITPDGTVSTLAGSGAFGSTNGIGTNAEFSVPEGVAVDGSGNVYVGDYSNDVIRKITPDGEVSTLAGSGIFGFADGNATTAQFKGPGKLAVDAMGNIYVSDTQNHSIRKITPAGDVSTLAGSGTAGFTDGNGANARFSNPGGIAVDASGNVYVGDNRRIRKITPMGEVSTLAGSGLLGSADGSGTAAQFSAPVGLCVDPSGNIFVADALNHRIRKVIADGEVSTLAGSTSGFSDGSGMNAKFFLPGGVAVDASGNVYVADAENNRIRKIQ